MLLLPVAAEEDAVIPSCTYIYLLLHAKFRMGSVTNISKTIPEALPEQQRRLSLIHI